MDVTTHSRRAFSPFFFFFFFFFSFWQ